jgi:DNA-binding protein HU-beta
MSRKILADAVQALGHTNGLQSSEVVSAVIDTLLKEIHRNKKFSLLRFGTFMVAKTKARKARNPQTGDIVNVPAGSTVRFRASKVLKKEVAKPVSKAKAKAKR